MATSGSLPSFTTPNFDGARRVIVRSISAMQLTGTLFRLHMRNGNMHYTSNRNAHSNTTVVTHGNFALHLLPPSQTENPFVRGFIVKKSFLSRFFGSGIKRFKFHEDHSYEKIAEILGLETQ